MAKEQWGSRLGIIMAVAGSAIGLGNFLRFPGLAAKYGGAFMIPYFTALLLLGLPLMWIEWTIGRFGGGFGHSTAPGMFHSMWEKNRFIKYFGAIGILVAQRSMATYRRWHEWRSLWSPVWLPLGSGLALLALLGTGPQSDLTAHLFGFSLGLVLAVPFCGQGGRRLPNWAQRLLELGCVLIVFAAWAAAIRHTA